MLRYHVAFYLPGPGDRMVIAEALDFPGAVSQGFDLADLAQVLLEKGEPLPRPNPDATAPEADLIETIGSR